jgi:hypothetical protein
MSHSAATIVLRQPFFAAAKGSFLRRNTALPSATT